MTSPGLRLLSFATRAHPCVHVGNLLAEEPNETFHVLPASFSSVITLLSFSKCSRTKGIGTDCSSNNQTVRQNHLNRRKVEFRDERNRFVPCFKITSIIVQEGGV